MGVYSVWPVFVCTAALLGLAWLPLFRRLDAPPGRQASLDGLRGFLALGVVFHHAAVTDVRLRTGLWEHPPSTFHDMLGPVAVSMFFMVTGFLFWSRLLRDHGRPDWLALYVGRVFRVGPVYLLAVSVVFCIVAARTGFTLRTPAAELLSHALRWLCLGAISGQDLNGYAGTLLIMAGVTWTLRWEWLFYACLPLAAPAARATRLRVALPLAGVLAAWMYIDIAAHPWSAASWALLFLIGMASASLSCGDVRPRLPDGVASAVAAALIAGVLAFPATVYGPETAILLGIAFHVIASGATVFGLLTCRAARRLGAASYGVYLLHGIVLNVASSVPALRRVALASAEGHWAGTLLCAAATFVLAAVVHVWIEKPGIALGRRAADALRLSRPLKNAGKPASAAGAS